MINLFTYGSLMCSDIMFSVTNTRLERSEAILEDFFRSTIHGEEYPGITPQQGARVSGIIYFNLPAPAIRNLDVFEGEFYIRQNVQVSTEQQGVTGAMTYIIKPHYKHILTNHEWSYEHFLSSGKTKFLQDYFGFDDVKDASSRHK
ncbi:MAG: gamma-glutamylcyclotransferase family protein [Desulforhopalus sp.]